MAWRQNTRFVGTIQNIVADIQRGRMMAIRENSDVGVELNPSDYTVFFRFGWGIQRIFDPTVDQLLANEQLPVGYSLSPVPSSDTPEFSFNGRGTTDIASELTMQVTANTGRIGFIRVNMLGRIGHTFQ